MTRVVRKQYLPSSMPSRATIDPPAKRHWRAVNGPPDRAYWVWLRPNHSSSQPVSYTVQNCCKVQRKMMQGPRIMYSKTCVKRPLSKRPKIGFQLQLSLNADQKAESMCTNYWLTACSSLHRKKYG